MIWMTSRETVARWDRRVECPLQGQLYSFLGTGQVPPPSWRSRMVLARRGSPSRQVSPPLLYDFFSATSVIGFASRTTLLRRLFDA